MTNFATAQLDTFDFMRLGDVQVEQVMTKREQALAARDTFWIAACEYWLYLHKNYDHAGKDEVAALAHLIKAQHFFERAGEEKILLKVYQQLAERYYRKNYFSEALEYNHKILALAEQHQDREWLAHTHAAISSIHWWMKRDSLHFLLHSDRAIELAQTIADSFLLAILYTEKGRYHLDRAEYDQAIAFSRMAVPLARAHKVTNLGWSIALEGMAWQGKGDCRRAIPKFTEAIPVFQRRREALSLKNNYCQLAFCYQEIERWDSAYLYLRKCDRLGDSLLLADKAAKIDDLLLEHRKLEQEQKIKTQEAELLVKEAETQRQKTAIFILVGGVLLLLLLGFGTWKYYSDRVRHQKRLREHAQLLQAQQMLNLEKQLEIETAHSLIQGQENERQRFARELHDGLGGMLSALRLQLDRLEQYLPASVKKINQKAVDILTLSIAEVRNISRHSLPESLERDGLITALNNFFAVLQQPGGLQIDFQHYGSICLSQNEELALYRIIQELVNNAVKHAKCSEIMVLLIQEGPQVSLTVADDGKGFSVEDGQKSSGLYNLERRVQFLKGELQIDSSPAFGTSVMLQFTKE